MNRFLTEKKNIVVLCIAVILIIIGVGAWIGTRGKAGNTDATEEAEGRKITLLCLGVDKQVAMSERHPETNSIGQADAIFLVSVDTGQKTVDIVAIPRDTIVTIEKYNHKMQYLGEEEAQICLQYAYADGMERSCELTIERVEELFPETEVNGYIAINIQAIMDINDAIGGVEVTVKDEYTALNMGIPVDTTLTLQGEQSMLYLRLRDKSVNGSAYSRMDRIKEYVSLMIPKGLDAVKEDPTIVADVFGTLGEHVITDIKLEDIVEIAWALKDMDASNMNYYTLQGQIILAEDGYEEFYPEEKFLMVLQKKFANKISEVD